MRDPTIPDETQLFVYVSMCLLRELEIALQLASVRCRLEPTGDRGIELPQLVVEHPALGWMNEVICALPFPVADQNAEWWFEWRLFSSCSCVRCTEKKPKRICRAIDMNSTARLIVEDLHQEPEEP